MQAQLTECRYPIISASTDTEQLTKLLTRGSAQVAELVDALASGASARKGVEVRVLSWAPSFLDIIMFFLIYQ